MKRILTIVAGFGLALSIAAPAVMAASPDAIRLDVRVALAGDLTASTTRGTFTMSGAVSDSGTAVGSGWFAGQGHLKTGAPNSLHGEMTFVGANGTIELYLVATFGQLPAALAEGDGHWWFGKGTGAYASLHGRGTFSAVADFRAAIARTGPPIVTFVNIGTVN